MIEIEKPNIHVLEFKENYGKFAVEPLERGFGHSQRSGVALFLDRAI